MSLLITRLQILVFAVLVVAGVSYAAYRVIYMAPYKRCEKLGAWYSPKDHVCARVMYIPNLTHRRAGEMTERKLPPAPATKATKAN